MKLIITLLMILTFPFYLVGLVITFIGYTLMHSFLWLSDYKETMYLKRYWKR